MTLPGIMGIAANRTAIGGGGSLTPLQSLLALLAAAGGLNGYTDFTTSAISGTAPTRTWASQDLSENDNDWTQPADAAIPLEVTAEGAVMGASTKLLYPVSGGTFTLVAGFIRDTAFTTSGTLIGDEELARFVQSAARDDAQGAAVTVIVGEAATVCATWQALYDVLEPLADGTRFVLVVENIDATGLTALAIGRGSGNLRGSTPNECAMLQHSTLSTNLAAAKAAAITVCSN